jgi:hypothetical protein
MRVIIVVRSSAKGRARPEVDQHDAAVGGADQVGRADVAVEHAGQVHRGQGVGRLPGHVERLGLGERPPAGPQLGGQGPPLQPLEDQVGGVVLLQHGEDADDVGVAEAGERGGLAAEALAGGGEGLGLVAGGRRWRCPGAGPPPGTAP